MGSFVSNLSSKDLVVGEAVAIGDGLIPVFRILARNAGMMTGPGTNSYLIGRQQMAVVDPGPLDQAHIDTLLRYIGERTLRWIFVTHTHGDHSPGASALAAATGAELIGLPAPCGSGQDPTFVPVREFSDGQRIECGDFTVRLVHTPGHVSNHFCYLLEDEQMLFTGDHILEGTTPVILPPDGSMGQYLDSLSKVKALNVRSLAPGHGRLMETPGSVIDTLVRHRLRRESKVAAALQSYTSSVNAVSVDELTKAVYDDVSPSLHIWASKTLMAHLIKLREDGRAACDNDCWFNVDAG